MASRPYALRLAGTADVPALEALIAVSARALQAPFYTPAQIDAALGPVFAVDEQLIADATYFVAEHERSIIACGGWSKRATLFGRSGGKVVHRDQSGTQVEWLDPRFDCARVRAFFVDPAWARRGIGTALLNACETAAAAAGFSTLELVATLSGEPLYTACSFVAVERFSIALTHGLSMPVVRMRKPIVRLHRAKDEPAH